MHIDSIFVDARQPTWNLRYMGSLGNFSTEDSRDVSLTMSSRRFMLGIFSLEHAVTVNVVNAEESRSIF